MGIAQLTTMDIAKFHRTIISIIVIVALLTAVAKGIALRRRWRDHHEIRRIAAIIGCLDCAYINGLRFLGLAPYNHDALAQGSIYILIFLFIIFGYAVSEWQPWHSWQMWRTWRPWRP